MAALSSREFRIKPRSATSLRDSVCLTAALPRTPISATPNSLPLSAQPSGHPSFLSNTASASLHWQHPQSAALTQRRPSLQGPALKQTVDKYSSRTPSWGPASPLPAQPSSQPLEMCASPQQATSVMRLESLPDAARGSDTDGPCLFEAHIERQRDRRFTHPQPTNRSAYPLAERRKR